MGQDNQNPIDIPQPEYSVRTGAVMPPVGGKPIILTDISQMKSAKEGDVLKINNNYYKSFKLENSTTLGWKQLQVQKGLWLRNKLQSLYKDPLYTKASPEDQKTYRGLAYDKWIAPYYQHNNMKAPGKDIFVESGKLFPQTSSSETAKRLGKIAGYSALKTTSSIMAHSQEPLEWLSSKIDGLANIHLPYITNEGHFATHRKVSQPLTDFFKENKEYAKILEDYYQSQIDNETHNELKDKIASGASSLGTEALFFETTGPSKIAKGLEIANPRTAKLAVQMGKAVINGAINFSVWEGALESLKPSKIGEAAVSGAAFGGLSKPFSNMGSDLLKKIFQYGGSEAAKPIVEQAVKDAKEGKFVDIKQFLSKDKQIEGTVLGRDEKSLLPDQTREPAIRLSADSRRASLVITNKLHGMAQERYKKNFNQLAWIQQRGLLNKFLAQLDDSRTRAILDPNKQLLQSFFSENEQKLFQAFPQAADSAKEADKTVLQLTEGSVNPVTNKLKATLEHHNTYIDSPLSQIGARISFLSNSLKKASQGEKAEIQKALDEEKQLLKDAREKREKLSKGNQTAGSIGGPSPRVGLNPSHEWTIEDSIAPYSAGRFAEWGEDSFAENIMRNIEKTNGPLDPQVKSIRDAFHIGRQLQIANSFSLTALHDSVSKQLIHPKFGHIGGINWRIENAGYLGEHSGFTNKDRVLYINYLGLRPNVVAKVWPVPGAGTSLFLEAAQAAHAQNLGIALIPSSSAVGFYEKLGMKTVGDFMVLTKDGVNELLRNKGLLMMLIGSGITAGAGKDFLLDNNNLVKGKDEKNGRPGTSNR